jgi:hypothetical protein
MWREAHSTRIFAFSIALVMSRRSLRFVREAETSAQPPSALSDETGDL